MARARQRRAGVIPSAGAIAPAGAIATVAAAATLAAAATKPDFSDGNLGPDSADGNLGDEHGAGVLGAGCQFSFFFSYVGGRAPQGPPKGAQGPWGLKTKGIPQACRW